MINRLKIILLILTFTLFFITIGSLFLGKLGIEIGLSISIIFSIILYWFSDKIILKIYKKQITNTKLNKQLARVSDIVGVKTPLLWILDTKIPNIFSTGRNIEHSNVIISSGLIELLNKKELDAVFAHELSHIKANDIQLSSMLAVVASIFMFFVYFYKRVYPFKIEEHNLFDEFLFILFAPVIAVLIKTFITEKQEFMADNGAKTVGFARDLVGALKKIAISSSPVKNIVKLETAHLFIHNPLSNKAISGLFRTHPLIKTRIKELLL